jgi:hypothetical protein
VGGAVGGVVALGVLAYFFCKWRAAASASEMRPLMG